MSIIGTVIVISTLNPGARYFGMFFMCAGPFIGLNVSFQVNGEGGQHNASADST